MPVNHHSPYVSRCSWCQVVVPRLDATPPKPSPREVLLSLVEELEKRKHAATLLCQDELERGNDRDGQDQIIYEFAYDDAITLIRSMAGHLMEPSE